MVLGAPISFSRAAGQARKALYEDFAEVGEPLWTGRHVHPMSVDQFTWTWSRGAFSPRLGMAGMAWSIGPGPDPNPGTGALYVYPFELERLRDRW